MIDVVAVHQGGYGPAYGGVGGAVGGGYPYHPGAFMAGAGPGAYPPMGFPPYGAGMAAYPWDMAAMTAAANAAAAAAAAASSSAGQAPPPVPLTPQQVRASLVYSFLTGLAL